MPIIVAVSDEFLRRNPGGDASGSSIASTTAWLLLAPSTFARAIAAAVRLEALKVAVPNPFELLRYLARARAPVIVSAAASEIAEDNIAVIAMAVPCLRCIPSSTSRWERSWALCCRMSLGSSGYLSTFNSTKPPDSNFTQMPACVVRSAWRLWYRAVMMITRDS